MQSGTPRKVNTIQAQSLSHAWDMQAKRATGKRRRQEGKKEIRNDA